MVAIVGGLLVARFVSIASQQEGAQRLVADAAGRLDIARRREEAAVSRLRDRDIRDFFTHKVIRAIGRGVLSAPKLRKIGDYTPLTDKDIADTATAIRTEFDTACSTLPPLIPPNTAREDYPQWDDFKHTQASLPDTDWDDAWEIAYEALVRPPRPKRTIVSADIPYSYTFPDVVFPPSVQHVSYSVLDAQRRDALLSDVAQAKQRVEDLQQEFDRLQRARDAVVKPKGLGGGLIVLGFFTLVGVIIPIWLMSRAPQRLSAHLGEVVFWLFLVGLLALLGYMTVLALRLSGWRKNKGNHDGEVTDNAGHDE